MARAATVNDDPMFLEMMADEVLKTGIAIARVFRWAWPSTAVKPSGRGLPARACRSPAEGLNVSA